MPGIVCAIRGGPDSRSTIEKSIDLAKEHDLTLYFLYVVNLDFLTHTASSRTHLISEEMHEMGDFILLDATTKADTHGVTSEGIVKQGKVGEEIIKLCKEKKADFAVLGRPKGTGEEENVDVFTTSRLREFSQQITEQSGAKVILVEGESE